MNKKNNIVLIFLIICATIFMGIGYAAVNGVLLNIEGTASAMSLDSLYISSALYSTSNGANIEESRINDFTRTTLNSTITLGNNQSSTITYSITIQNTTEYAYSFSGTSYSAPNFYDNNNITFTLGNINVGDTINPNSSKTFTITFSYLGSDISNPTLNSYISFDFDKIFTITYQNINTSGQNYPTSMLENETKIISFAGDIPYDVNITPSTINYSYNNGVLTINNANENIIINRYYSLTFITEGTNNANQPTKYLHGQVVNFLDPTNGTKLFDGWYINSSYSGNPISNTSGYNENLTLYAKWIDTGTIYNISYELNGGTQANNQVYSFSNGNTQTILDPEHAHDATFGGWYDNGGFTGSVIASTSQLTGNTTLYAKWQSSIANTSFDTTTNRFSATNVNNLGLRNFTGSTYQYTQSVANITINSIRIYLKYSSGNKTATLTCQIAGNQTQQTTFNLNTNQTNTTIDAVINLNTPIQKGSNYTISCPSYTGDNNGKIKVNGLEFILN